MSKTAYMRGLQNFIQDIRSAQNKEQEQRRVEKELAKIRERFVEDRSLSGYDRRKYVWKLLYIYMLGYEIEFGHKQAADLIPLPKYKDKQVGYMACSLLLRENDEFLRLTMNAVRLDLTSRNEAFETLALSFIGNIGGTEMADALTQDVIKLLSSGTARPLVKKRASLALLRLIRKTASDNTVVTADTFSPVINALLEERDLGLLLSAATLLQGVCARNGSAGYEGCQLRLIKVLERLTMQREREVPPEYLYYGIPSPWLQCKCLRVLQFFPPPETAAERATLNTILQGVIDSVGAGDAAKLANPNKANALYAILFEAIALTLQYDTDRQLLTTCVTVLGNFLSAKEPNVKYLALETLSRLALVPEILEAIRHHQSTVVASLKDADVSIRKRSMDLLFTMCDTSCAEELVREMLAYLVVADFSIREELVLKVAILAEKFAPNVQWYVDVALELLEKAGDFVSEEVWHRVVQLVTNNPAMQQYAARNVAAVLKRGAAHESLICTAAYILGEFGRLVVSDVPPREQFKLLNDTFPAASQQTKGLLMTAYIKIYLLEPQNSALRNDVLGLFERYQKFMDAELQQRAVEYMRIAAQPQAAAQQYLLPMPKWEERESSLLKRLQQTEGQDADSVPAAFATSGATSQGQHYGSAGPTSPEKPASGTTHLVVGPPIADGPPPAPPATQPSVDLLGGDTPKAANGAPTEPAGTAPRGPSNPVDLLSDLLGDAVITPPVAAAPAPGMQQAQGYGSMTGAGPQPPYAGATGAAPPYGQPGYPGAPGPYAGATGYSQQSAAPYAGYTGASAAAPGAPYAGYTGAPAGGNPYAAAAPAPAAGQYAGAGPYAGYTGAAAPANPPYAGYTGAPAPPAAAPTTGSYTSATAPAPGAAPYAGYTGAPAPPAAAPTTGSYTSAAAPAPGAAPYAGYTGAPAPAPAAGPYAGYTGAPAPSAAPYAGYTGASTTGPYAGFTGAQGFAPPTAGPTGQSAYSASQPAMQQSSSFAAASNAAYAAAAAGVEPVKPLGSVEQWYASLLVKDRGILYEDTHLQIGLQARYTRGTGQVVLFLGNKSRDTALTSLQLIAHPPPNGLQVSVSPPPALLAPGQQVQVAIQVAALAPFSGAPGMLLDYQLTGGGQGGQGVRQELRLPVVPHKFIVPEPTIPSATFFGEWKTFSAPPNKAQETVERPAPGSQATVLTAVRLANLGAEHGHLDPSPHNEAGAGYFVCGQPGAPEQPVLVMVRVEANPVGMTQFRVTAASAAPQLVSHVMEIITSYIRTATA